MTPLVADQGDVPDSKPGLPTTFVPSQPAAFACSADGPATRPAASAMSAAYVLFLMGRDPSWAGESLPVTRPQRTRHVPAWSQTGCAKDEGAAASPARDQPDCKGYPLYDVRQADVQPSVSSPSSCRMGVTGQSAGYSSSSSSASAYSRLRYLRDSRSPNTMPCVWSVSCCRQRASSASPSNVTGSPVWSAPVTLAQSGRTHLVNAPGSDRQPSSPSSSRRSLSVRTSTTGLHTTPEWMLPWASGHSNTNSCRSTPTWFAANPTPSAARMVATMSATSFASSSPNSVTGLHTWCITSSPQRVMGSTVPSEGSFGMDRILRGAPDVTCPGSRAGRIGVGQTLVSSRKATQSRTSARSYDGPLSGITNWRLPTASSSGPRLSGAWSPTLTERSISPGSRPRSAQCRSRTSCLCAIVSALPNPCQMCACFAVYRSVLRSPPPPIRIG